MSDFRVPVVDVSVWVDAERSGAEGSGTERPGAERSDGARARVATAMDVACCTVGFVQVVGHGIPTDVTDGLTAATGGLFALPTATKLGYLAAPGTQDGYRLDADGGETFAVSTAAGAAPGIGLPAEVAGFLAAVGAYVDEVARVSRTLTRIFAAALGLPDDFFADVTDRSVHVLKLISHDVAVGDRPGSTARGTGMHTDRSIVTVTRAERATGLQVLGPDGCWHDVVPAHGALLVNPGDLMARWTNDEWRSAWQRTVAPPSDATVGPRRSAVFSHDGNPDAVVSAIPSCVPLGHRPTYPPITIGAYRATS